MAAAQAAKIRVEGASKVYQTRSGPTPALWRFSCEVAQGELVCILGPSGCGKSTLLWAMAGLQPLSEGRITIDGAPVTRPRPEVGLIFQDANLLPWRTVRKNVELPFEIKGLDARKYQRRIQELLDKVGLSGFEEKYPRELSGGMRQRASLVRGLAPDPSILLMDEPFGALDAFTREEMNLLIQQIWMETGKTVVFVTSNISEAIFLADRVLVMTRRPGRLAQEFAIPFARPRRLDIMTTPTFISIIHGVKAAIERGTGEGPALRAVG